MNIEDGESFVLDRDNFCSWQITILMVKCLVRSNARLEDETVLSVGLYSCLLTGCLIFCMFLTEGIFAKLHPAHPTISTVAKQDLIPVPQYPKLTSTSRRKTLVSILS